jgi:hypothetical protein
MRDICFLKFGKTLHNGTVANDDFCTVKTVYNISIDFTSLGSVLFWSLCNTTVQH